MHQTPEVDSIVNLSEEPMLLACDTPAKFPDPETVKYQPKEDKKL
jgi:hypothetical protein